MDRKALERAIDEVEWRATTYLSPHEYVVERDHQELFRAIRERLGDVETSYKALFLSQVYTYTNVGPYRYWTVGIILNRARLDAADVERE
ncbi:MAG: hypothetical protein V3U52_06530 [Thermoplasmata archaeon]